MAAHLSAFINGLLHKLNSIHPYAYTRVLVCVGGGGLSRVVQEYTTIFRHIFILFFNTLIKFLKHAYRYRWFRVWHRDKEADNLGGTDCVSLSWIGGRMMFARSKWPIETLTSSLSVSLPLSPLAYTRTHEQVNCGHLN